MRHNKGLRHIPQTVATLLLLSCYPGTMSFPFRVPAGQAIQGDTNGIHQETRPNLVPLPGARRPHTWQVPRHKTQDDRFGKTLFRGMPQGGRAIQATTRLAGRHLVGPTERRVSQTFRVEQSAQCKQAK